MDPHRILVVEDEGIVALDIQNRLAAMGYMPVGSAASSEEAVELVGEQRPELVLMDIRLQGARDGIDAAEEVRRRFHVPVIFLTAYSEDATLERAKRAEPFGYLLKPFNDRELKSTIEIALYKHQAEEEIRRMNRLFDVLSQVNQAVVRIRSRKELLEAVCRQVVERGAIDLAWIVWLDPETFQIKPVAWSGNRSELSSHADFHANGLSEGQGTTGKAIREGRPFVCNECGGASCLYPPAQVPARFGFQSCGSFPLRFQGQVRGALSLCVAEPGFFRDREIQLMKEIAMDVSFALDKIEGDAQRERIGEEYHRQSVFLQTLIDAMPFPIFYKDARLRYLGCNAALEQFAGIGRDRFIGRSVRDIWPEDLAETYDRTDRELLASTNPRPLIFESAMQLAVGLRYDVLIHKAVFRNQDGSVGGIIGAIQDITERKRAEEALRTSEERLRAIIDNAKGAIWVKDLEGRFLIVNRYIEDALGVPRERQIGRTVYDLWPRDLADEHTHNDRRVIESGEATEFEESARLKDGEHTFLSVKFPLCDASGRIYALGAICTDITERKRVEEERVRVEAQLRQAQKMEALGTLAGGIAHDFNNILGIIIGYTEMAEWRVGEGSSLRGDLRQVLNASNRAKDLVQQILAFSRRSEQEKRPVRLGLIVKEALKMLRASLPSTIEIKQNVKSEAVVMADPTQMHQVLMNLCTNAAHAMLGNGGGVLEVSLTDARLGSESIVVSHPDLQPGNYVKLTIKDTGEGIDPVILDRIFDPFFTTKEQGVGTGLGLAVVHGIVKSCGGAIEVESAPGSGATFRVFFPAMWSSREPATVEVAPLPGGRERILLVDDEPALAMALKEMLEHLGYEVDLRSNGIEALETFRLHLAERPFDLVVTDLTMPQLGGADLARELLVLQPNLPIVLCTGFSDKMDAEQAAGLGIRGFLMKPVVIRELAEMIREVLDKR